MSFGEKVRQRRMEKGMKQAELAEKIDSTLKRQTISKWENEPSAYRFKENKRKRFIAVIKTRSKSLPHNISRAFRSGWLWIFLMARCGRYCFHR